MRSADWYKFRFPLLTLIYFSFSISNFVTYRLVIVFAFDFGIFFPGHGIGNEILDSITHENDIFSEQSRISVDTDYSDGLISR